MEMQEIDPRGVWLYVPYPDGARENSLITKFAVRGGRGIVLNATMSESLGYLKNAVPYIHKLGLQAVPIIEMPNRQNVDHWVYQEVRNTECEAVIVAPHPKAALTDWAVLEWVSGIIRNRDDVQSAWSVALKDVQALYQYRPHGAERTDRFDELITDFSTNGLISGFLFADNNLASGQPSTEVFSSVRNRFRTKIPLYWPQITAGDSEANNLTLLIDSAKGAANADVPGIVLSESLFSDPSNLWEAVSILSNFPEKVPGAEQTRSIVASLGLTETRTRSEDVHDEIAQSVMAPNEAEEKGGEDEIDSGEVESSSEDKTPLVDADNNSLTEEQPDAAAHNLATTPAAHPDTPLDCRRLRNFDDPLGHRPYVSALYQLLSHEDTGLPLSLAVSAPWGSGKTSIMRWLKCDMDFRRLGLDHTEGLLPLDENEEPISDEDLGLTRTFKTVWLDAWQYEDGPALWAALTKAVYEQCQSQVGDGEVGIWKLKARSKWLGRLKFRLALAHGMEVTQRTTAESAATERTSGVARSVLISIGEFLTGPLPIIGDDEERQNSVEDLSWRSILRSMANRYFRRWQPYAFVAGFASAVVSAVAVTFADAADAWLAVVAPGFVAALGSVGSIRGIVRQPFSFNLDKYATETAGPVPPSYSQQGADEISRMVRLFAPGIHDAVAIFVDDLDRCSPHRVMDTLEAVNLLFGGATGKTAFILGMDVDMVAASVRVAYADMVKELQDRGNPAAGDYGFRFLSKIVQLTFTIPAPSPERIVGLVETLVDHTEQPKPEPEGGSRNGDKAATQALGPEQSDRSGSEQPERVTELTEEEREALNTQWNSIKQNTTDQEVRAKQATAIIEDASNEAKPAVEKFVNDRYRADASFRSRKDSSDVRDAILRGSVLLEKRPRDVIRFVNAVRLQFLVMDQVLVAGKGRATPDQVGKWTAMVMRWPVISEQYRWTPDLVEKLEAWACNPNHPPRTLNEVWPITIQELLDDPASSADLRKLLTEAPSLMGANLHGLLPVQ